MTGDRHYSQCAGIRAAACGGDYRRRGCGGISSARRVPTRYEFEREGETQMTKVREEEVPELEEVKR